MSFTGDLGRRLVVARMGRSQVVGRAITQTEVARALGVNPSTVSMWESGSSRPTLENLVALARFYEIDPGHLTFGNDDDPPVEPPATARRESEPGV